MSKCFISYRHVKPDEEMAGFLEKFLSRNNHKVFVDTGILVGTKWAEEIEKQLRESEIFIVLLSKESIRSEMVRQEVKLAHQLSQERGGKFTILPVRVDFDGELPHDLGVYLDSIQYAKWTPGVPFETVAGQLLAAIEEHKALPEKKQVQDDAASASGIQTLFDATDGIGAPLPAADLRLSSQIELNTGTVRLDSPFYVKRGIDEEISRQIKKTGSTTKVKGARQTGKSSLLARAYGEAKNLEQKAFYLDFQMVDEAKLTSMAALCKDLAWKISEELKTGIEPDDCWKDHRGAKDNLTKFMKEAVLKEAREPVLLLFDEVDRVFSCSFRDDFFAVLRGWHNRRATEDCWKYLNLIIAHSTEPYLWIKDINQSPFNVGYLIEMADFDISRVKEANARYGSPLRSETEIEDLLDLTGGQPFLVCASLYMLGKKEYAFSQLKKQAVEDRGPLGDHLRRFLWILHEEKELKDALGQVLRSGSCADEMCFFRLRSAGLVKGENRQSVQMRCRLYSEYFRSHL
ncbi:MAG: AAA-like domain-containing protein [Candidatus Aminicenantes bacterium]|nr:AAA-like domain-containing protein [Candidatus Aminicenantes bacterium]